MSENLKSNILIIGKNGQVGGELVDLCCDQGVRFIATGSDDLDITDREAVFELFETVKPSVVINAAAYTAVDQAEDEPEKAFAINVDGVENLALACKKQNIPLVHISTDYVFDGEKSEPYVETDIPNPVNVYGKSKLAGEQVLQANWERHWIIRVSWVFGKYGNNFVKTMLRLARERDELAVVDDQYGAPTSAEDIARVIVDDLLGKGIDFGFYHLQSEPGVTWYEFAHAIFQEGKNLGLLEQVPSVRPISSNEFPFRVVRPKNSKLNTRMSKLCSVRWSPALKKVFIPKT